MSPRATRQTPSGPSRTAVLPMTSRTVHPSMVVGLVSGTGTKCGRSRVPPGTAIAARCSGLVADDEDDFRMLGEVALALRPDSEALRASMRAVSFCFAGEAIVDCSNARCHVAPPIHPIANVV